MSDYISDKHVTTRKDHTCWGCLRTIQKGSKAHVWTGAPDGDIMTIYHCMTCDKIQDYLEEDYRDEGYGSGWTLEEIEGRRCSGKTPEEFLEQLEKEARND